MTLTLKIFEQKLRYLGITFFTIKSCFRDRIYLF